MDVNYQHHAQATLPPGVKPYPLNGRLGGPQTGLGNTEKRNPNLT